jgi:hypothetical protein
MVIINVNVMSIINDVINNGINVKPIIVVMCVCVMKVMAVMCNVNSVVMANGVSMYVNVMCNANNNINNG